MGRANNDEYKGNKTVCYRYMGRANNDEHTGNTSVCYQYKGTTNKDEYTGNKTEQTLGEIEKYICKLIVWWDLPLEINLVGDIFGPYTLGITLEKIEIE